MVKFRHRTLWNDSEVYHLARTRLIQIRLAPDEVEWPDTKPTRYVRRADLRKLFLSKPIESKLHFKSIGGYSTLIKCFEANVWSASYDGFLKTLCIGCVSFSVKESAQIKRWALKKVTDD